MLEIRVNNQSLDLNKGELVALTFALANIGRLDTREGTTTNTFTIPLTNSNRSKLGFVDQLNVTGQTVNPYTKVDCEVFQDQLLITKGYLKIENVNQKTKEVEVSIFGDNVAWFALVKDVNLWDLDFTEYDHTYDEISVSNNILSTTGYFYPIINYGLFTNGLREYLGCDANELYPALYVETILKKIFDHIGYKVTGTLFNIPLFKKSFLPFTNEPTEYQVDSYDALYQLFKTDLLRFTPSKIDQENRNKGFYARTLTLQSLTSAPSKINFETVLSGSNDLSLKLQNLENNYSISASRYVAKGTYKILFSASFSRVYDVLDNPASAVTVIFKKNGITAYTATAVGAGLLQYTVKNIPISLISGDYVEVFMSSAALSAITSPNTGGFYTDFYGEILNTVERNDRVSVASSLPDMNAADFLKTIFAQYGVLTKVNQFTKTVTLDTFNDLILRKPSAVDWSGKIDLSENQEINFSEVIGEYGRKSFFRYKKDDEDKTARRLDSRWPAGSFFGDGFISIDNDFIEQEANFFESEFAPTTNSLCFNSNIYLPNIIRHSTDPIVFDRQDGTVSITNGSANVVGVGTTFTSLKVGQLIKIYNLVRRITVITDALNLTVGFAYTVTQATQPYSSAAITNVTTEPRILINLGMMAVTSFKVQNLTITAQVPLCFFIKDDFTGQSETFKNFKQSLAFDFPSSIYPGTQGLREMYYKSLTSMLNTPKFIRASFKLSQLDIHNLDMTYPIFIDFYKAYFYINKIAEYKPDNSSTIVELIKLP